MVFDVYKQSLMYQGSPSCIQAVSGVSCQSLRYPGSSWRQSLVYPGSPYVVSRQSLIYPGSPWCIQVVSVISRKSLMYPGSPWCIQVVSGILWQSLMYPGSLVYIQRLHYGILWFSDVWDCSLALSSPALLLPPVTKADLCSQLKLQSPWWSLSSNAAIYNLGRGFVMHGEYCN